MPAGTFKDSIEHSARVLNMFGGHRSGCCFGKYFPQVHKILCRLTPVFI